MTISTKSFSTLVSDAVAAVQGQASALLDFSVGGVIRAIIEAVAGVSIWLESLVLQVAALTRASTSNGADLDSFVNDYGLSRGAAVSSVVVVTFARFTPSAQAVIPPGAQVGTLDGTQAFVVTEDDANPAWSTPLGGYVLPASVSSVSGIPVKAVTPGASGNVVANSIGLILTAIPGVDTVTNPGPATGGADQESDAALRIRFQQFILSLASATRAAIAFAINSVQPGLAYDIQEDVNPDGSPRPGYLTITVDDGTGSPPTDLLNAVYVAVDNERAAGIAFGIFPPTTVAANVVMTVTPAAGYSGATLASQVQSAIASFIAGLKLGASLPYSKLTQVAFDTSPGVANVTGYTLNSGTADLDITGSQKVVAGTITVTS